MAIVDTKSVYHNDRVGGILSQVVLESRHDLPGQFVEIDTGHAETNIGTPYLQIVEQPVFECRIIRRTGENQFEIHVLTLPLGSLYGSDDRQPP